MEEKMVECGLEVSPSYTKHPEVVRLWNKWINATILMSTGNCVHPTWDALVDYCRHNMREMCGFASDYITCNGSAGWMICTLIDKSIGRPLLMPGKNVHGYINPNSEEVATVYKLFCDALQTWNDQEIDDFINKPDLNKFFKIEVIDNGGEK